MRGYKKPKFDVRGVYIVTILKQFYIKPASSLGGIVFRSLSILIEMRYCIDKILIDAKDCYTLIGHVIFFYSSIDTSPSKT